jgi:hypothetical protein
MQVDTSGIMLNSSSLSSSQGTLQPASFFQGSAGGYYITGLYQTNQNAVYIIKTDSLLSIDCNTQPVAYNGTSINMKMIDFDLDSLPGLAEISVSLSSSPWLMAESNFCSETAINEFYNDAEFLIFPNPFANAINIYAKSQSESEIIFYDITSRKILHQKFTDAVLLDTEQLAKGIYIYEVRNKDGSCRKGKVVKE